MPSEQQRSEAKAGLQRGFRPDGRPGSFPARRRGLASDRSASSPPADYPAGQRDRLCAAAQETLGVLPDVLRQLDGQRQDAAQEAERLSADILPRLHPDDCPALARPATLRVVDDDALNVAVAMAREPATAVPSPSPPPLVVSFANRHSPGGGWLGGAMAQEEALCYRSSLSLSLRRSLYPLGRDELLYSPCVLVVRSSLSAGHRLLVPSTPARLLPVVSVVTVAALHKPQVRPLTVRESRRRQQHRVQEDSCLPFAPSPLSPPSPPSPPKERTKLVYARDRDRDATKAKMRLTLRAAAVHGHDRLVLGALGCGVYGNPAEDVAHCWLEVLREDEFAGAGHWWRDVVFAVYAGCGGSGSRDGSSNYSIFHRILDGQQV